MAEMQNFKVSQFLGMEVLYNLICSWSHCVSVCHSVRVFQRAFDIRYGNRDVTDNDYVMIFIMMIIMTLKTCDDKIDESLDMVIALLLTEVLFLFI